MELNFSKILHEKLGDNFDIITSTEKSFGDWIDRLRWHVRKCNELSEKYLREHKVIYKKHDGYMGIFCPICKHKIPYRSLNFMPKHCMECGCKINM